MAPRSLDQLAAPALLSIGTILAGANWWLRPEHAWHWVLCLALFAAMAVVRIRGSRTNAGMPPHSPPAEQARDAVTWSSLILVITLGVKLAGALGLDASSGFAERALMILLGGFLVVTGNTLPKNLTPLAAMRCDPARAQAFHRFAGWTWVLTGLALIGSWLLLPVGSARSLSFVLLPGSTIALAVRLARVRRTRRHEA